MQKPSTTSIGLGYAVSAYGLWGLIPLYFKAVAGVAPLEVLAHRVLWSSAVLVVVLLFSQQHSQWRVAFATWRTITLLTLSTLLIGVNWLTFIYAVSNGQVLQSSLGYFVTPLANVLLGVLFLGERLRWLQWLSFGLAAVALAAPVWLLGQFPSVALSLAVSFSLYGLLKKIIPVGGLVSLAIETLLLAPVALGYLVVLTREGASTTSTDHMQMVLALSGVVTTVPLLFFAAAARRLEMKTLGIVQYLTPSLQMILAVVVFGETLSIDRIASFVIIWLAIGLYLFDLFRARRSLKMSLAEEVVGD